MLGWWLAPLSSSQQGHTIIKIPSRDKGGGEGENWGPHLTWDSGPEMLERQELRDSPTSTTELLGDLGQLPSPAWASGSSSVN